MTEEKKKVGVIGLGYVGLTLSVALAKRGLKVYGSEINVELREKLKRGEPHFFEKGMKPALQRVLSNQSFEISDSTPKDCEIYVSCVSTPFNKEKNEPNLFMLKNASHELKKVLHKGILVVNRSTVPIGMTRKIMLPILESSGMKCGEDFSLAFAPERTLEGKAMQELLSNSQIIGGFDEESSDRASALFRKITPTIVNVSSLEAAEAIKLLDNTYRDVRFAFANQIAEMCEEMKLDAVELTRASNIHYPRNNIPVPSPGVGGACLTKDGRLLASSCNHELSLIKEARKINESVHERMVKRIYEKLEEIGVDTQNPRFYLCGFAFKGDPVTDDLRDSTSLWFLDALKTRTTNIVGYDPVIKNETLKKITGIELVENHVDGFKNADCVVILNNHKDYGDWKFKELIGHMNQPSIIFDAWRKNQDGDGSFPDLHYMSVGL